jgi:hypothetical protein
MEEVVTLLNAAVRFGVVFVRQVGIAINRIFPLVKVVFIDELPKKS